MGISWWARTPLKKLCNRIGDGLHGTPQYDEESDFYFINGNNLKNGKIVITKDTKTVAQSDYESNLIELDENSLLLSINGTLGGLAFYDNQKVMLGKSAAYLNFKSGISRFYYYYFQLKDVQKYFNNVATGSTIKNLGLKSIQDFKVPVPDEKEWQPVAILLSNIDAKIELNNRINLELEAMAKLIYDYWFVQFDFPDANDKPYKSSSGKMIYNEDLKREIPEGWSGECVVSLLETVLGGTPSTLVDEYWNGDIPWLNSGEIANFPILEAEKCITREGIHNSATSLLPAGTCVLSITRHLRPSVLAVDACANQSVVGICESDKLKYTYLYPYLKNEIPRLMSRRTGAQQPHINKAIVDESKIVDPPSEVMRNYYEIVEPIYNQIVNGAFQNQKLEKLRDWLLPMLMNGQVKVCDNVKTKVLRQSANLKQAYSQVSLIEVE